MVSRQYKEKQDALSYLDAVIERLQSTKKPLADGKKLLDEPIHESLLYIKMQIAQLKLDQQGQKECKELLDDGKMILDSMTDIDPSVYAAYYWVSSEYYKYRLEFAEFYKSALLYLAYTSVESLPDQFKVDLAFDLILSALLGDNIYDFGELLVHPIIESLQGHWAYDFLQAFNSGDLDRYDYLCSKHKGDLSAQPALVENEEKLLEKIRISCLMEMIFSLPPSERTIPLSVIAQRTRLSVEGVEHLLMRSLSVHLIEGLIDQVDETMHFSWVRPRILGIPQIKSLRDGFNNWCVKVKYGLSFMEGKISGLVHSPESQNQEVKDTLVAKKIKTDLRKYAYKLRDTINTDVFASQMDPADKEKIDATIEEVMKLLGGNDLDTVEVKMEELHSLCNPIFVSLLNSIPDCINEKEEKEVFLLYDDITAGYRAMLYFRLVMSENLQMKVEESMIRDGVKINCDKLFEWMKDLKMAIKELDENLKGCRLKEDEDMSDDEEFTDEVL